MRCLQRFSPQLCAAALAAVSLSSVAQDTGVAYVKTVTGDAWVTTTGQRIKASPGTPISIGSHLKTAPGATLGVTFKDNTLMDEYLYAPAQGQLQLTTKLARGSLNYVSGVIAKLKPEAVQVKTPTGIIGVRGTQFVARVEDAQ